MSAWVSSTSYNVNKVADLISLDNVPSQFMNPLPKYDDNELSLSSQISARDSSEHSISDLPDSSAFANLFPFGIDLLPSCEIPTQINQTWKSAEGDARTDVFTESDRVNSVNVNGLGKGEEEGRTAKKAEKARTKPVTVEELTHDNSRFAKVVKAFLSIHEEESRTVPEIAKKVGELYSGQYADFETVKVSLRFGVLLLLHRSAALLTM